MALIQKLITENIAVTVLARKDSPRKAQFPKHPLIKVVDCSLEEMKDYLPEEEDYDVFYHFAWAGTFGNSRNDMDLQVKNIQYTLDAVRLAKRFGCKKFIGAGSQAEYGRFEGKLTPQTPVFPENGYGIAKLCAGQMSRELAHQLGIQHIWTRILSIYGPYDGKNTMVMSTIQKLKNGEVPQMTKGEQLWDYLYSGDAANAFYLLAEKGLDDKTYVLGSGEARPLKEYIEIIRDIVAPESRIDFGAIPYSERQVMHLCADIGNLEKDTGFKPQMTFKNGIQQIFNSSEQN